MSKCTVISVDVSTCVVVNVSIVSIVRYLCCNNNKKCSLMKKKMSSAAVFVDAYRLRNLWSVVYELIYHCLLANQNSGIAIYHCWFLIIGLNSQRALARANAVILLLNNLG